MNRLWLLFCQAITILLAFVIFQMVKMVNRIRSAEAPPPAVTPEDIILLREIRDSLQNKKDNGSK